MESKKNEILSTIKNIMQSLGFEEMETNSPDFSIAYVQKGPQDTHRIFLIVDSTIFKVHKLRELKTNSRAWCVKHFDVTLGRKNCGLNLILLHQNELIEDSMKELIDKSSLNVPILQSITAININNLLVTQSKTWIVIGPIKKVLKELKNISVS